MTRARPKDQITWEYNHLRRAHVILFWFPAEEIQPISLFELGAWTHVMKLLAIGTHTNYARREDVIIQTELARPELYVFNDLDHTIGSAVFQLAKFDPSLNA